jgi:hypothetical protein
MAVKRKFGTRPYVELCEWIEANGGKVRLGRTMDSFTLVVEAPSTISPHRVAGYAFGDISELDEHALLILIWLSDQNVRPRADGDAATV